MSKRIIYKQISLKEMLRILYEASISETPIEVPKFYLRDAYTYSEINSVDLIGEKICTDLYHIYSYFEWELEDSHIYIEETGEDDD